MLTVACPITINQTSLYQKLHLKLNYVSCNFLVFKYEKKKLKPYFPKSQLCIYSNQQKLLQFYMCMYINYAPLFCVPGSWLSKFKKTSFNHLRVFFLSIKFSNLYCRCNFACSASLLSIWKKVFNTDFDFTYK
ncbi:hypothetical protein RclHR1_05510012 [Rhizophagus clarus]|uniref:Uncharacterized protein n=1 Tax=Rhizophagus clarus TaxID=94130 RepID=A0A2Z6RPC4_9GLOM|nr:hypothetical protein RclHR1_05510012 [Rhizophagus clarus]